MNNKKLREDEEFVIGALADFMSGTWAAGEDPPDAYLTFGGKTVAVEISTLNQYVGDHSGKLISRFSQDATALKLIEELNKELSTRLPRNCTVHLSLESPINKKRKFKPLLAKKILELTKHLDDSQPVEYSAFENKVEIHLNSSERPAGDKVVGLVMNQNASADILMNAQFILDDRLAVKDKKCQFLKFGGSLWLALFNDYWLADVETYKQAIARSTVRHRFHKVLLVSGNRSVETLI